MKFCYCQVDSLEEPSVCCMGLNPAHSHTFVLFIPFHLYDLKIKPRLKLGRKVRRNASVELLIQQVTLSATFVSICTLVGIYCMCRVMLQCQVLYLILGQTITRLLGRIPTVRLRVCDFNLKSSNSLVLKVNLGEALSDEVHTVYLEIKTNVASGEVSSIL